MADVQRMEKIWLDGRMIPWDEAQVPILTHTLHYGLGAFEGIRCYQCSDGRSAIFRLQEHIDRLYDSAHIAMMTIPFPKEKILQACKDIFTVNKLKEGYLRPIAFIGHGAMGLHAVDNPIRVAVIAWPWGTYLGEDGVKNGIRAKISSYTRLAVNVNLPKAKLCGNYINSILAKREAMLAGYEEAILLDAQGYIAEASGENVFMVKGGEVITPPTGSSILPGITRDSVLALLRDNKIPYREQGFTRDSAYIADELFLSGTAAELTPIRELDNRKIGVGRPGPITQTIQSLYHDIVRGKNKTYSDWLAYL